MEHTSVLGAPSTKMIEKLFLSPQSEKADQTTERIEAAVSTHAPHKKAAHQKDDALPIHLL